MLPTIRLARILVVVLGVLLPPARLGGQKPPDIILVIVDDMPAHMQQFLPLTNALVADSGVTFANAFVSTPACCPSRASILTGLYSHNHGVHGNVAPQGGATVFDPSSTVAVWLQNVGYRTALVGKYLNQYGMLAPQVPPGWTDWFAFVREQYWDFHLVENDTVIHYAKDPLAADSTYSTNVLTRKAVRFIEQAPSGTPLFLYFAPFAPHAPAAVPPADTSSFVPPLRGWRSGAYNEADVSDKPTWVRNLPPMTKSAKTELDRLYRRMAKTLRPVDRGVRAIADALARTGRLENAVIIFTSDNAFALGAHRWNRKSCAYDACTRVPLLIRAPGVAARTDEHLVLNIDLAPTIAALAGIVPPTPVDGMSLVPLLGHSPEEWREGILLEFLEEIHDGRTFQAVRTGEYLYAEYTNADRELYDLTADPFQLENVIDDPAYAVIVLDLKVKLEKLKAE